MGDRLITYMSVQVLPATNDVNVSDVSGILFTVKPHLSGIQLSGNSAIRTSFLGNAKTQRNYETLKCLLFEIHVHVHVLYV